MSNEPVLHDRPSGPLSPRRLLGIFLALLGILLALDRLNLVDAGDILRFWPVGPILLGALISVQARDAGGRLNGLIVSGIGCWLLLTTQGIVHVRFWELFWPIILIVVGINLARQTGRRRGSVPPDRNSEISMFAVWSAVRRSSSASPFRGATITAIMGGGRLDLREATIPPGDEAVIDVTAIMGGFEVVVPSAWEVSTPIVALMGGVEDHRLPAIRTQDRPIGQDRAPRLTIRGFTMMGGIHIKS